jgi:hypothetical protein
MTRFCFFDHGGGQNADVVRCPGVNFRFHVVDDCGIIYDP